MCLIPVAMAQWILSLWYIAWMAYTECCPTDFITFPGTTRCFKHMGPTVRLDFVSSEKMCRSFGRSGHIAIFDGPALATWVISNLIPNTTTHLWVGVNDLHENSVYRNNDGTMATLQHAYPGAGMWTDSVEEGCLRGNVNLNLQYFDTKCRYGHEFVCEMDATLYEPPAPSDQLTDLYETIGEPRTAEWTQLKSMEGIGMFECGCMCSRYGQCAAFYLHPDTGACRLLKYANPVYTFPNGTVLHQWLLV